MAGVPLPKYSKEEEARDEKRKTLHEVMELAAKFFEATLAVARRRQGARLSRRPRPRAATQFKFRLGYAPGERFALKEHLGEQGVSVEDMVEAGLLIAGDDIPVPYDRFRDRVMFPITDFRGRMIAFGGRALAEGRAGEISQFAGDAALSQGREALQRRRSARQAVHDGAHADRGRRLCRRDRDGDARAIAATVAPLGTALTEDQLGLLWKMADEPMLCFDGDKAGRRAAYRAVDMAMPRLKPGKSLRFAMLPEGQDPDDLVRSGGREAVAEVLSARAAARRDAVDARDRSRRVRHAGAPRRASRRGSHEVVRSIGDEAVRKYYAQDFSARAAAVVHAAAGSGARRTRRADRPARPAASSGARAGPAISAISRAAGTASGASGRRESARADVAAELASVGEPDRARVPHRAAAARGADPGGGGQPPLAAGAPRRGVFRARIPQSRHRSPAAGGPGRRHRLPMRPTPRRCARRSRRGGLTGVLTRVEAAITHTSDWPARTGRFRRGRGPMVDPRCYLASQAAHVK